MVFFIYFLDIMLFNHHHLLLIKKLHILCQFITTPCQVESGFQGTKNQKLSVLSATVNPRTTIHWDSSGNKPSTACLLSLPAPKDELGVWTYALAVKSLKIWIQRLICRTVEVCVVHVVLTVCSRSFVFEGTASFYFFTSFVCVWDALKQTAAMILLDLCFGG